LPPSPPSPSPPSPSPSPPAPPSRHDACFPVPTAPWCNTSLSIDQRVAAVIKALTIEEKIVQVSTFTPHTVPGVDRIGLPAFSYHSEGLHGIRRSRDVEDWNATIFPQTTALAATGNISMIWAMGGVMYSARFQTDFRTLFFHSRMPLDRTISEGGTTVQLASMHLQMGACVCGPPGGARCIGIPMPNGKRKR
jgi:hypothetical protein